MGAMMSRDEVMRQLKAWGTENARQINARHGAGENQFGVNLSNLRTLAKTLKTNHDLAMELWGTGNVEAMLLATMIMRPKALSEAEVETMMHGVSYFKIADWFGDNVVKKVPFKEALRGRWMNTDHEYVGRVGWSLTTEKVVKEAAKGLDLDQVVGQIEAEMKGAPYRKQEAMNRCLVEIAIRHPALRARCIDIGTRLEVFKDYPVPKGCTSPYAPLWIAEMVGRGATGAIGRKIAD